MQTELKLISKEELIRRFKEIEALGWIENTTRKTNDGAAGNKLEDLLGIPENNLPIPNAAEWELKTQRDSTSSLLTLFHLEPSPRALKIVSDILLPQYGWVHKEAGLKYPNDEKSFRATLDSKSYTRGFSIQVDEIERKINVVFDPSKVLEKDKEWLDSIRDRVEDMNKLSVTPYWGFDDLFGKARAKLLNCFYVVFETKNLKSKKYFHYYKVYKLQNLNIDNFIAAIKEGLIYIDFDARTGHNHGTKFRIVPKAILCLYSCCETVLDYPTLS